MPPGDPRNPCASHVKIEGLGNGNSFIIDKRVSIDTISLDLK